MSGEACKLCNTYKTPTGIIIKTILGRSVVHNEEKRRAKRRGDLCNGAPGGTKRSQNSQRKPKNRETSG